MKQVNICGSSLTNEDFLTVNTSTDIGTSGRPRLQHALSCLDRVLLVPYPCFTRALHVSYSCLFVNATKKTEVWLLFFLSGRRSRRQYSGENDTKRLSAWKAAVFRDTTR